MQDLIKLIFDIKVTTNSCDPELQCTQCNLCLYYFVCVCRVVSYVLCCVCVCVQIMESDLVEMNFDLKKMPLGK